jgi:hypothetical protein
MQHMRTTFITVVGILGLVIFSATNAICLDAGSHQKTPPEKNAAAEIERLVKDLGSSNIQAREAASRRLRELPKSRHYLRRNMHGKDLETRRRMEEIIKEHARNEFKRRLAELAKDGADAPIDLVTDLLLENRNDVGEQEWKHTVEIVTAIAEKLSKGKKGFPKIPDRDFDFRKCEDVIGGIHSADIIGRCRIIVDELIATKGTDLNVAVVSKRFASEDNARNIILVNGDIRVGGKSAKGVGCFGSCFIYCDGDISCEYAGPILIARGRIHFERGDLLRKGIIVDNARQSSAIRLFSLERTGLKLIQQGVHLRVESLVANSKWEKSDMKPGDIISMEQSTGDLISALERTVRKSYVKESDLELDIVREGRRQTIAISLVD